MSARNREEDGERWGSEEGCQDEGRGWGEPEEGRRGLGMHSTVRIMRERNNVQKEGDRKVPRRRTKLDAKKKKIEEKRNFKGREEKKSVPKECRK